MDDLYNGYPQYRHWLPPLPDHVIFFKYGSLVLGLGGSSHEPGVQLTRHLDDPESLIVMKESAVLTYSRPVADRWPPPAALWLCGTGGRWDGRLLVLDGEKNGFPRYAADSPAAGGGSLAISHTPVSGPYTRVGDWVRVVGFYRQA